MSLDEFRKRLGSRTWFTWSRRFQMVSLEIAGAGTLLAIFFNFISTVIYFYESNCQVPHSVTGNIYNPQLKSILNF